MPPLTYLACTTGKDTGYYYRPNVRASGALYDIRLPIRVVANLNEGAVEALWGAAVWSKSSGKVQVFLSAMGEKWSISDSIVVLQSFGGSLSPGVMPGPPGRVGREGGKTAWGEGTEAGS